MMWENVTPFQVDKLWSQVVHYYMDKKKMSKEEANKIAAAVVKKRLRKTHVKILHVDISNQSI